MKCTFEGENVTLKMTPDEWRGLMILVGFAAAAAHDQHPDIAEFSLNLARNMHRTYVEAKDDAASATKGGA
jgi:hypothetical protein